MSVYNIKFYFNSPFVFSIMWRLGSTKPNGTVQFVKIMCTAKRDSWQILDYVNITQNHGKPTISF